MSNEVTTTVEGSPDVVEVTPTVELSPIEQEAISQGWMPKEEWVAAGNNEEDHRSAKEFVERGELYKSLSQTKGELKRTQVALTALQRHHVHVFEMAQKRALEELKQERRAAIRNDDLETAEAISEEMDALKEQHARERAEFVHQTQAAEQVATPPPEWNNWKARNTWYETDRDMKDEADSIGLVYLSRNPGTPPERVLEHVEKEIKRRYPEKFASGRKAAPNAVVAVDRTTGRKGPAAPEIELTELELEIERQLVSSGEMTKQQYRSELRKAKGIK